MFPDSPAGFGPAGFGPVGWSPVCRAEVLVLSVERYPRDPDSGGGLLAAPGGGDGHLYDLGLSEGHCRLRAVLHPALNPLVCNNRLRSGCQLSGVRLGLEYDERRLGGGGKVFVLLEAQVVARGDGAAPPAAGKLKLKRLQVGGEEPAQAPELPLRARRSYYLPLWDSANYYGATWHEQPPGHPARRLEGSRINLKQLEDYIWQKKKDLPPVIVRILRKYRLYHFGRPDRYSECPFQLLFHVNLTFAERPDEFLAYRWLHLIDGTASEPFVLKLFSTSQPEIQAQIAPCSVADNTGRCPLTTMSELKQLLNQLEYREYRRVTVQGRIISVTYQSLAKVDGESACDRRDVGIGGIEEFEELFNADQSFPDKTRNKSPVIPLTRSGSPLGKQAGLSQKRRRKGSKKRPSASALEITIYISDLEITISTSDYINDLEITICINYLEATINISDLEITIYINDLEITIYISDLEIIYISDLEITIYINDLEITIYINDLEIMIYIRFGNHDLYQ
ncbi:hypothetical protein scyTo_0008100 [Scyliorhinus torazame]|uniref:Uncharacterized protein n=1 Tax=Scyliorhinus torazame TaxID=75743 RepID=A0A401P3L1_SCYTO|nr:hypothetical protein [Scyliorhinus torazame]